MHADPGIEVSLAKGFFITFEGGEGTGKSTQMRLLAEALSARGYRVLTTREPGGSVGAEAVRHVLLSGAAESSESAWRRSSLRPPAAIMSRR